MSADLGNLYERMRLECKHCGWVPPEDMEMAIVQAHMDMDHDLRGEVHLNLVPACECGNTMGHTRSSSAGGSRKDYFRCPIDGNTGFVLLSDVQERAKKGFTKPGGES